MKVNSLCFVICIAICFTTSAQTTRLKINPDIVMPEDSLKCKALLFSVNAFLSSAQENRENEWILDAERVETQILIDEIQDIQKNEEYENDAFFDPYLTNIVPLENDKFAVHIAYIGVHEHSANLRANFKLIAHKRDDSYLISSPLLRNTRNWKTKRVHNQIYYYPYTLNVEKVQRYSNLTSSFDEKLKNYDVETHYYLCDNEIDPLKIFGVEYKSDYNGEEFARRYSSSVDNKSLFIMNATRFYNYPEHDVWHFRLSQVISRREVHRRVDCHIATLYGGLWGISWEELFPMFSRKFVVGNDVDWLDHKKNSSHFVTTGGRKNYTDDFVGALLIKKIEEEKGFEGVWELLMTKRTKEEEEYFSILEKLTGITIQSYNQEVHKLIEEEMNNQGI